MYVVFFIDDEDKYSLEMDCPPRIGEMVSLPEGHFVVSQVEHAIITEADGVRLRPAGVWIHMEKLPIGNLLELTPRQERDVTDREHGA